ncbi:MAG: hypothetical protein AAF423_04760 [Pseudomonadota bacterium]
MIEEKDWYMSKTIWGSMIAVAASLSGGLGISLDTQSQAELADAIIQVIGAMGAIFAIYGRLNATEVIS